MKRTETPIDLLANELVLDMANRYPSFATDIGYPGGEGDMDDHSPEALANEQLAIKNVLAKLAALEPQDQIDEVTKDAMTASLTQEIQSYDSGLHFRNLNNIASPAQGVRDIFDNSPTATAKDWENLASRMRKVESSLAGYIETLRIGLSANDAPAKRQVEAVIDQVRQITATDGFFREFAKDAKAEEGELSSHLMEDLAEAAEAATARICKIWFVFRKRTLARCNH